MSKVNWWERGRLFPDYPQEPKPLKSALDAPIGKRRVCPGCGLPRAESDFLRKDKFNKRCFLCRSNTGHTERIRWEEL